MRHGFEDLGLQRIFAETMAINDASRGHNGQRGMGYKRTFYVDFGEDTIPGSDAGEVEYEITLNEWQSRVSQRP